MREAWKRFYRQYRIARRECAKAHFDTCVYGTGYVMISNDGFINHIKPEAITHA